MKILFTLNKLTNSSFLSLSLTFPSSSRQKLSFLYFFLPSSKIQPLRTSFFSLIDISLQFHSSFSILKHLKFFFSLTLSLTPALVSFITFSRSSIEQKCFFLLLLNSLRTKHQHPTYHGIEREKRKNINASHLKEKHSLIVHIVPHTKKRKNSEMGRKNFPFFFLLFSFSSSHPRNSEMKIPPMLFSLSSFCCCCFCCCFFSAEKRKKGMNACFFSEKKN